MSARSKEKKGKLENPAKHYNSPDDIVNDDDLSALAAEYVLGTLEPDERSLLCDRSRPVSVGAAANRCLWPGFDRSSP